MRPTTEEPAGEEDEEADERPDGARDIPLESSTPATAKPLRGEHSHRGVADYRVGSYPKATNSN